MRLPSYNDLSREQDNVYLMAPLTGAILVSGPPGSGKTVMAFYRADTVARKGNQPTIIMFNRVLEQYTRSIPYALENLQEGHTQTFFVWLRRLWGAVFNGKWLPQVASFQPDWFEMTRRLLSDDQKLQAAVARFGHLIVDEGQDFAPGFYDLASCILLAGPEHVSIAVFADENQRISQGRNSTLGDIERSLLLKKEFHYRLSRNYRNTREIASAAACFYAGLPGGIPKLPDTTGPKPRVTRTAAIGESALRIARFVAANEDLEVAVFLPNTNLRTKYYNRLRSQVGKLVNSVTIQVYAGDGAEHLKFDQGGTVTVLCAQSAKGLEFDAVFVPDLQQYMIDASNEQATKMMLYVVSSRARKYLHFMYSADSRDDVPLLKYLSQNDGVVEWADGKAQ